MQDQCSILEDIHFTVEPGQRVALVGPSGAGKSTLVTLIPRFYDVTSGSVYIDGQDVRDLQVKSLRQHIGVVMQDAILFSGSIEDNLRYGKPNATQDEIIAACRAANALDFILAQPNGFQTEVGEGGSFLFRRSKTTPHHRPRLSQKSKDLDFGRGHRRKGCRSERLVKEALKPGDWPHHLHHRAPPFHHRQLR